MRNRYSKEIKGEVLGKIRSGQKVSEVAKTYGIKETTVRTWLDRDTVSPGSETLELSRLRRENESLLGLVGQPTYESDMRKKFSNVVVTPHRSSKSKLARELGVSRASLYYRRKMPDKDEELRCRIEAAEFLPGFI